MKKALLVATVLLIAVVSTACINNIAVQELNNKAAEYMQKGDYESAVSRLQASIDLDSSMYETYYNLGIASTGAKKYETAVDAFEQGIKINPDYENFYYSLAVAQAEWADEIVSDSSKDSEEDNVENKDEQEVSEADKTKAVELKKSAIENLNKYLEKNPQPEDKDTVDELMKDCEEFVSNASSQVSQNSES